MNGVQCRLTHSLGSVVCDAMKVQESKQADVRTFRSDCLKNGGVFCSCIGIGDSGCGDISYRTEQSLILVVATSLESEAEADWTICPLGCFLEWLVRILVYSR